MSKPRQNRATPGRGPASFSIKPVSIQRINDLKVRFLQHSCPALQDLIEELGTKHAILRVIPENNTLIADCNLQREAPNADEIAATWSKDVKDILTKHLGRINFHKVKINEPQWAKMEERVTDSDLESDDVLLLKLEPERAFIVVGKVPAVDDAFEKLKYLNRSISSDSKDSRPKANQGAAQSLDRKSLRLEGHQLLLLSVMSFRDDMQKQYRDLKVFVNTKTKEITFSGNPQDVKDVEAVMHERLSTVTSRDVPMSEGQIKLLGETQTRSFIVQRFKADTILAVWEDASHGEHHLLQVYAPSDRELQKAADILQTQVKEQECIVPNGKVSLIESSDFKTLLEEMKCKYRGKLLITVTDGGQRIVVTATNDVIETASEQVKRFVEEGIRPHKGDKKCLRLEPHQFLLLSVMSFKDDMQKQHQGLTVFMNTKTKEITFTGNQQDTEGAKTVMREKLSTVTSRDVTMSAGQIKLLGESETRSFIVQRFRADTILAVWEDASHGEHHLLQVYAPSDRELQKAAEILQTHVKEQECRVPPGNSDLMQSSEFHTLAESLKSKYRGKLLFTVTDGGQKIAITATNDVIESASEQVKEFVREKTRQTETFPIAVNKARFVRTFLSDNVSAIEKKFDVKILLAEREFSICGTQEAIQSATKDMETLVSESIACHLKKMTDDLHIQFLNTDSCGHELQSLEKIYRCVLTLDPDDPSPEALQGPQTSPGCDAHTEVLETTDAPGNAPSGNPDDALPPVKIVRGDIAQRKVDVLVSSVRPDLKLDTGEISKSVFRAAGQGIQDEVNANNPQGATVWTSVYTQGHNLQCGQVCHMVLGKWGHGAEEALTKMITDCLMEAHKKGFTSIAVPTLGTGGLNYPQEKVAQAILNAISCFYRNLPTTTLRDITIVIHQTDDRAFQVFQEVQRRLEGQPTPGADVHAQRATLYIYASAESTVRDVVNAFDAILENNIKVQKVEEKAFGLMNAEEVQRIKQICLEHQVVLTQSDGHFFLRGLNTDVLGATVEIKTMFHSSAQEHSEHTLAQMLQWYYLQGSGSETEKKAYSPSDNFKIEEAYKAAKFTLEIVISDVVMIVDFGTMTQHPKSSPASQTRVFREDRLKEAAKQELPGHWTGNKSLFQKIPLSADSEEYRNVEANFRSTLGNQQLVLVKIDRVQNPKMWKQYAAQKEHMEKQDTGNVNEKTLWHGTHVDAMDRIARFGFDRGYCGKNATAYGQGVYFAINSSYSSSKTYSPQDPKTGNRHIFQCKVLVGVAAQGKGGMRTLPDRHDRCGLPYDSATDNPHKPNMYVIFSDNQAYPEYLITFRDK